MKVTLILISLGLAQQQSNIPKELLAAQQNRNFATNGLVSWSYSSGGVTVHCTTKFAGDEWIHRRSSPGSITNELHKDGEYWINTSDNFAVCNIKDAPFPDVFDARTIGFSPKGMSETLDHITSNPLSLPRTIGQKTYAVSDDGPYRLITTRIVSATGTNYTVKQWLDPDKGLNVVRSQMFVEGDLKSESITLLQDDGRGHWFPSSTNVYRGNESEPTVTITVDETVFDDESLPASLGPEDIGVEIGTNIHRRSVPSGPDDHAGMHGLLSWDGGKLVPFKEMADRVNRGELKVGPKVAAILSGLRTKDLLRRTFNQKIRNRYENSDTHRQMTQARSSKDIFRAWELYVLRFIKFYGLTADQQSKAMSVYRTLRARGETYLKRKQPDFEKLSKKIDALVSLSETKNKQKVVNELADERLRLEKPIIELFNKQLKPRLTSLLTRKQRARGEMK